MDLQQFLNRFLLTGPLDVFGKSRAQTFTQGQNMLQNAYFYSKTVKIAQYCQWTLPQTSLLLVVILLSRSSITSMAAGGLPLDSAIPLNTNSWLHCRLAEARRPAWKRTSRHKGKIFFDKTKKILNFNLDICIWIKLNMEHIIGGHRGWKLLEGAPTIKS